MSQNSDSLWDELHAAGLREHDRFWRMPLDEEYGPQIYGHNADLVNVRLARPLPVLDQLSHAMHLQTGGSRAGCCTAALFLKSFVEGVDPADGAEEPAIRWAHLDIAGSMEVCTWFLFTVEC